jgi:hypothetical protein
MREMNYQYTQQFERATMPQLPIQLLLVLCGVTARFLFAVSWFNYITITSVPGDVRFKLRIKIKIKY